MAIKYPMWGLKDPNEDLVAFISELLDLGDILLELKFLSGVRPTMDGPEFVVERDPLCDSYMSKQVDMR